MSILAILTLVSAPAVTSPVLPFDASSRQVLATFHAEGVQIYECKAGPAGKATWTFREPLATLIENGKTVGRHFAGPSWELDEGSLVRGHLAQSLPGATLSDVPILNLDVVRHDRAGRLDGATKVYRIHTRSGALAGACDAIGTFRAVPYSADYVFAR